MWEVRLPERTSAPLGARRPSAQVVIIVAPDDEETVKVPVPVAKSLLARKDEGGLLVRSRADLMHEIRGLEETCAMERLAGMIDRRDYSCKEASDKLRLDGFSSSAIDGALRRALESGMLDDARFAGAFMRSKLQAGWGIRRIEQSLYQRGIDAGEVEGWPEAFLDGESEFDRALDAASRRRVPDKNAFPKIVRFLMGRGFSAGVASDVARTIIERQRELDCS